MDAPAMSWHARATAWFVRHAESGHALWWLALVAFCDSIFFPIAPEVFLVALMLAHPGRWKQYLLVALSASVAGACVAYYIAHALFAQFGAPILDFYGATAKFQEIQHLLRGHVFLTMLIGNFSPVPDKIFIYAAGFLGAHFIPFITGYAAGRGARMSVAMYLTGQYGAQALSIIRRYILISAAVAVALATIYAMVHWHLLGL